MPLALRPGRKTQRRWTPATVIAELNRRWDANEPLNTKHILQSDKMLYKAACREFGTWIAAIRAAGLDPEKTYAANAKPPSGRLVSDGERHGTTSIARTVRVAIPDELARAIDRKAELEGISRQAIVIRAIKRELA